LGPDRLTLAIQLTPRRALLDADGPRSEALRQSVLAALVPDSRNHEAKTSFKSA
jgi:hypothetical protein